jgi:hypothetical protein
MSISAFWSITTEDLEMTRSALTFESLTVISSVSPSAK